MYDNDDAGRKGSARIARYLKENTKAKNVYIVDIAQLIETDKSDITDYFMQGGTKEAVVKALSNVTTEYTQEHINKYEEEKVNIREVKFEEADKYTNELLTSKVQVAATYDSS